MGRKYAQPLQNREREGAASKTSLFVSTLELAILFSLALFSSAAQARTVLPTSLPAGLVKPPVIDKQDIRFNRLTASGESLQSRIWSIAQDNYGFLWLGTSDGLYRYDGYTLKRYPHELHSPNSVSDDTVVMVYKDRAGLLWICTKFGGLDRFDPTHETFQHYRHQPDNPRSLSDDSVNCAYEDPLGSLWVGTNDGLDRLDRPTGTFVHYKHNPQDPGSLSNNSVNAVLEDRHGNLWVGTKWGLNRLDRTTSHFSRFLHDPANPNSLGHNYVGRVREDHSGILWLASTLGSGLSALDVNTGKFTRYSFHAEEPGEQSVVGVNSTFEDADGMLWLSTVDRGLLKLDRDRKTFIRYSKAPGDPNSLPHDTVHVVFEDAEGMMWVGTQSGLCRFPRTPPAFVDYKHSADNPNSLHDNMIWSVQEDSKGFLWIGTEDGLDRLDRSAGRFTLYRHDPKDAHSLSYGKVAAIREDRSGALWFGTYGGGLDRFDPKTEKFIAYRHEPGNPRSLGSDSVLSLLTGSKGVLWVGTQGGGLNRFDPKTGNFKAYWSESIDIDSLLLALFEDRAGLLWVGTQGQGLYRFDPKTEQFTHYDHDSEDPRSLSQNKVNAIREDRQGRLWIGTENGLNQMDRSRGTFTAFTTKDGLPDNAIKAILEDNRGYLWLATHNGLSRFDPATRTFHNYFESDGLASNFLNPYAEEDSCQSQDGEIVLGSSDGLTTFYPGRISVDSYVPPVALTEFQLFNTPVRPGKKSPLSRPIWATDSLTLAHDQSIFTLEFAALSYAAPERNRYRYRLDGLEKQWNEVDSGRRRATYTSLPAGTYLFRVQGSNNDGVWNSKGVTLAITVLPPWWATWWFRSIAGLVIVGLILAAYRSRVKGLRLQTARLERQIAERTYELQIAKDAAEKANGAKSTFLANMSHELRTPLNAILGFSNLMRSSAGIPVKERQSLDIINRSGEHLLSLINDVLDMAKIDAGRTVLQSAPLDLRELVRGVLDLMRLRAEEKGLELFFEQSSGLCHSIWGDAEKLRQVLLNLVGNAVKFTERGSVTVRLEGEQCGDLQVPLRIEVQDTGAGISQEERDRIFEPFVQVGQVSSQKGTGLGLAITKQFIELMGGTIQVESTPGEGSLFRVEITVQKADEAEHAKPRNTWGRIIGLEPGQPEYRVLIVEDQLENWLLLRTLLESAGFLVQVSEDGPSGIEQFRTWRPQFIWMDWRLPGMDGLEVTRRIRLLDGGRDVKIAVLTASAFTEHRAEAEAAGVDDFVRKPFQADEIFDCLERHLGVRYTYDDTTIETPGIAALYKPDAALRQADLAALPEELRTELADALVLLDIDRIARAASRISERDAALGHALLQYTQRCAYSSILQALRSVESIQAESAI